MIPFRVRKAIDLLRGYCEKHNYCEKCPLNYFCSNEKAKIPSDWNSQEVKE